MPEELQGTYWTVLEVAHTFDISKSYVSRLIREGKLQAKRIGDLDLITEKSLTAWMLKRRGKHDD